VVDARKEDRKLALVDQTTPPRNPRLPQLARFD